MDIKDFFKALINHIFLTNSISSLFSSHFSRTTVVFKIAPEREVTGSPLWNCINIAVSILEELVWFYELNTIDLLIEIMQGTNLMNDQLLNWFKCRSFKSKQSFWRCLDDKMLWRAPHYLKWYDKLSPVFEWFHNIKLYLLFLIWIFIVSNW